MQGLMAKLWQWRWRTIDKIAIFTLDRTKASVKIFSCVTDILYRQINRQMSIQSAPDRLQIMTGGRLHMSNLTTSMNPGVGSAGQHNPTPFLG
jgi:hypothetical protein